MTRPLSARDAHGIDPASGQNGERLRFPNLNLNAFGRSNRRSDELAARVAAAAMHPATAMVFAVIIAAAGSQAMAQSSVNRDVLAAQETAQTSSASSITQSAVTAACDRPEHAQLDFWIGEWDVHWSAANGQSGIGTSRVQRDHGGCVVIERYEDSTTAFSGTSISSFQPGLGRWTQAFMATGNFAYQATGGPVETAAMEFELVRRNESSPKARIRFESVRPNSFTWRFQTTTSDGAWTDLTTSHYRRRPTTRDGS